MRCWFGGSGVLAGGSQGREGEGREGEGDGGLQRLAGGREGGAGGVYGRAEGRHAGAVAADADRGCG